MILQLKLGDGVTLSFFYLDKPENEYYASAKKRKQSYEKVY